VSECDREASIMRRPWPTRGCRGMKKSLLGSGLVEEGTYSPDLTERDFCMSLSSTSQKCAKNAGAYVDI
jgi:hypothetical protein